MDFNGLSMVLVKLKASSTIGLYFITLPGSNPHDAVIINLGLLSSILPANSFAANPPNTTECMAPILAHANMQNVAAGIIGK